MTRLSLTLRALRNLNRERAYASRHGAPLRHANDADTDVYILDLNAGYVRPAATGPVLQTGQRCRGNVSGRHPGARPAPTTKESP